jgi:hypothetical protein
MRTSYPVQVRSRLKPVLVLVLLTVLLSTSACSGDAQVRQRSLANQRQFQQELSLARQQGMTDAVLQSVLQQAQQLQSSQPPFSPFSDQPVNNYYRSLSARYGNLARQLQTLEVSATAQQVSKAKGALAQSQSLLLTLSNRGLPADNFHPLVTRVQMLLAHAKTFGDYALAEQQAQRIQQDLQAMTMTSNHLDSIKSMISLLQDNNLDSTTLKAGYQDDQAAFEQVDSHVALQRLMARLDARYQQGVVTMMLAAPRLTTTLLTTFSNLVHQLPTYHVDDTPYQLRLQADRALVLRGDPLSFTSFQHFIQQVNSDVNETQSTLLRAETTTIIQHFHRDVVSYSPVHMHHDDYDGNNYALDTSYLPDNFGNDADDLLSQAKSVSDLQSALQTAQVLQFNHRLFELDNADNTPYDHVHQADTLALQHYHLLHGQVIMVSLAKQTLRLYQDGKLVRAFLVTTGRTERPSPPGVYSVINRLAPTEFRSDEPPGSPYWYPPTHINYAILMRGDGYFIHDSWWRDDYGPGTQFPHADSGGDAYAVNGSHGCVNLPTNEAAWLYNNTGWNTAIIVY